MSTVATFPRAVERIDPVWIPLKDGTRLAARVWRPVDAEANPVPAILEYLPYRRRDFTAPRDALTHPYVAGHGYVCVRVDMRGSGDSDGILTDEYLALEQDDALEVIAWLAAQPWCTGAVGMMGHSWGGFNALQVAARRPPSLRAIITSCSTDDRYADDIHYMGGTLLLDNLRWASTMFAHNSRPPDPAVVGDRWREMWLARLRGSGLWIETWLRHPRRDAFWQHGSVCEDFAAIECPVFAVGGWLDGYTNAIPRLLQGLAGPRQGLIGQWAHRYPHMALPGPAVGFLQLAIGWWDRWLKGREPGASNEPLLRVFIQDSVPPAAHHATLPGRWVAERAWPSPRITPRRYVLHPARLAAEPGPEVALTLRSPETLGLYAGRWCPYQVTPDLPLDQRLEDGGALVFDTDPLPARVELLGAPVAELELAGGSPGGAARRAPLRRRARRRGHARELRAPEPHPSGKPRVPDAAPARPPLSRPSPAERRGAGHSPGAPDPPRALDRLLADRLAVARAGNADALRGCQHGNAPVRPPDPEDAALAPLHPSRRHRRSR